MSNRQALDRLRAELARRGLPGHYCKRLLEELDDHFHDLKEENLVSTEVIERRKQSTPLERLGRVEDLADSVETNYRGRTFVGRHPLLAFLIAPIPLTLVGWVGFLLLGFGLFSLLPYVLGDAYQLEGKTVDQWPAMSIWIAQAIHQTMRLLPPAVLAMIFCLLAYRSNVKWRWALLACTLVAMVAGMYTSTMNLPVEAGRGMYTVGMGFGLGLPDAMHLAQFLLPLLVAFFFLWFWHRRERLVAG